MSLNTPLKRPDFQGENVTSPSLSAGGTTADSDSSGHTLQQVSGTSADGDMPGDLWAQAYTALDPAVIETYEQILLAQDAKSKSGQGRFLNLQRGSYLTAGLAAVSHQQQEELWKMAKNALEDIDLVEWKEHISYSVNIDEFDKVVRVVIAAKDFVSSAVDAEAHAILVWAGVCIFLPLLVNTPVQKWTVDGLQAISAALHRIQVLQGQIEPDDYDAEAGSLLQDFKNSTVELYEAVIEFQIRLVEYSYNRVNRYARVHEANEWQLTKRINDLEGDCTRAARLLSRSRIDQALRGSHRKTDYILYKIRDGLEKPTRGIEPQILQTIWRQIDKERDCIELFRLSTPYEDQKNRTPTRAPETGRWFLEHRRFIDWRDSAGPGLLWLSGEPGSGKSVLARAVIDEGFAISSQQEQTAVCYFFFKDISSYHRSAESAVAAILHQLFSAFPSLVEHAMFSYRFNGTHLLSLFDDMFNILCQAAADPAVGQVVCVLDTTDECSDDARISPITAIASFYRKAKVASNPKSESKLKFLLTSRPCSDMYSQLHDLIQENPAVHLPANDECENIRDEINHVIDARVPGLASQRGFSGEAARYLVQQLHSVDNPTYLWLTLIMEEIRLLQRPANDLEARQIIQALPRSLPDAFDAIMMRSTNVDLARKLLHIILAAREPLTVKDISIATALADNPRYCSYEELEVEKSGLFKMGIKDICGLVTIQDGHVFLIHQTLKEFLLHQDDTENSGMWKYSFDRTDSEALMVTICIALLPFPCFSENLLTAGEGSDERRGYIDHGFLRYAALYWTDHAQEAELGDDEKWTEELTALCSVGKPICKTWYTIYQASNQTFPRDITSLNLAAQLRFTNVLTVLLNSGEDPNEPDGHGQTPLARSVEVQSLKAVERLLDAGANVDAQVPEEPWYNTDNEPSEIEFSPCSGTPLTRAVYSGNLGMVKCLLDRGATVDLVPEGSRTPLCAAIDMCSANSEGPDICRLLVQRGANVSIGLCLGEYNDKIITTALHAAAGNCIPPSVLCDLLQSETADVNFKTRAIDDVQAGLELDDIDGLPVSQLTGVTALHLAIQGGFVQNVEILLEHGADMHIRDSRGQTAMHHALCLPELDKSPPTRKMVISLLEQYDGRLTPAN